MPPSKEGEAEGLPTDCVAPQTEAMQGLLGTEGHMHPQ